MDVLQIAKSRAEILHRTSNWAQYSTFDGSYDPRTFAGKLEEEVLQRIKLETMTTELAMSRARATNRDFETVSMEVEFEVMVQLAKILAKSIDPAFAGTTRKVMEEEWVVCAVCQEEMVKGEETRAMGCMHEFHPFCIVQWLKRKTTCPLCRYQMQTSDSDCMNMFSC